MSLCWMAQHMPQETPATQNALHMPGNSITQQWVSKQKIFHTNPLSQSKKIKFC